MAGCDARDSSHDRARALSSEDPETAWVRWYQPELAEPGFHLVLHERRTPMIRDMNGRAVHAWPDVNATGRVLLSREGDLLVNGADERVLEYSWDGDLLRVLPLANPGDLPHHDLLELSDGGHILLAQEVEGDRSDYLLEVDSDNQAVWQWRIVDHRDAFEAWDPGSTNPTHLNSVSEVPPNRWFESGDERFRPGNLLVSARNLNTVFVIDRATDEVVWQYSDGLDRQHEAIMIDAPHPHEGRIILVNNGLENVHASRRSEIQIVDPLSREVAWRWGSDYFYTSYGGVAQPMPGGNVVVTSSQGGRVFELTPAGRIVWEWAPAYLPMRVERLTYDHSAQLASLKPRSEVAVTPSDLAPFISRQLFTFARSTEVAPQRLARRQVMKSKNACRRMVFPPDASLKVAFGFDPDRLNGRQGSVRFTVTLAASAGGGEVVTLLDGDFRPQERKAWRGRTFALAEWAYRSAELCLAMEAASGEDLLDAALWSHPKLEFDDDSPVEDEFAPDDEDISDEERALRKRQLETMGYIN